MAWLLLIIAGIEEVISVIAMKYVNGLKRKLPIIIMVIGFFLSISALTFAMKQIPAGVAYAVWAAMGSIGITLVGVFWFKEKLTRGQMMSLGLLLSGVVILKMTT